MPFCKFSSSYIISDKTIVDNVFINDFLPYASENCVKVYLMGLSKCNNASASDNNIENFANVLNISQEEVEKAFLYWQEQGLVQVLSTKPIEIRYLPVSANLGSVKKYKVDKYADFNLQMQEILSSRMLTPTEFAEYYNIIETCHLEPEALIMIAKYCADLKGSNIRYPYIIAVAKDWANSGVHTTQDVENKIEELGVLDDKVQLVLSALKTKRKIQLEDVQMLNRWLDDYDFDLNVVVYVAKRISLKAKADILILNNQLAKYYEMKLSSILEIEEYENEKQSLFDTAKNVVKGLGLFYEDLSRVVDTYVVKWKHMGYNKDVLETMADYCFKNSIRTLESFDSTVQKLFKLGITSLDALNEYLTDLRFTDNQIAQILELLGIKRSVNSFDRTYYKTWTSVWNFSDEMISYATSLSVDKSNAIQYLNKILSNWKIKGITTLEQAKSETNIEKPKQTNFSASQKPATKDEISALFSNLEYVDV